MSLPIPVALGLAVASETANQLVGVDPIMTRGAVRYITRTATYSLRASREVLGYAPKVDLDEGMRLTEAWLREKGYV